MDSPKSNSLSAEKVNKLSVADAIASLPPRKTLLCENDELIPLRIKNKEITESRNTMRSVLSHQMREKSLSAVSAALSTL